MRVGMYAMDKLNSQGARITLLADDIKVIIGKMEQAERERDELKRRLLALERQLGVRA